MDNNAKEKKIKLIKYIIPVIIFIISLSGYIITLCPTVYVGDSGEFIANAFVLGLNHAPGYPVHSLLGHLFIMLMPFASAAYAVNFLSAFAGAVAVTILYFVLISLTKNRILSAAIALMFAFSFTFWSRTTIAEIYSLNILFVALAILLIIKWDEHPDPRYLLAFAFIAGLGLGQHISGTVVAVAALVFVLIKDKSTIKKFPLVLQIFAFFIVGFGIYLFLYFRAFSDASFPFGKEGGFSKFLTFILPNPGATKRLFKETNSEPMLKQVIWLIKQVFTKEFWYFGLLIVTSVFAFKRNWKIFVFFILIVLLNIFLTIRSTLELYGDLDAHLIVTFFVSSIFVGIGLTEVINRVKQKFSLNRRLVVIICGVFIVLPVILFVKHKKANDRSNNYIAQHMAENFAAGIEKNGIIFISEDEEYFLLKYLAKVENKRKDISVVPSSQLANIAIKNRIFNPKDSDQQKQLVLLKVADKIIGDFIDKRPLYLAFEQFPINGLREKYKFVPSGLVTRILKKDDIGENRDVALKFDDDLENIYLDNRSTAILNYIYLSQFLYNAENWDLLGNYNAVLKNIEQFENYPLEKKDVKYNLSYYFKGKALLALGRAKEAAESFTYSLQYQPDNWKSYEGRGNSFYAMNDFIKAKIDWQRSLSINPRNENVRNRLKEMEITK